jgi:hypothetical protein
MNAAAGNFALASDSDARGNGDARCVAMCDPDKKSKETKEVKICPQADGTLNRGALQDYGLVHVPELEAQTALLLAEI